MYNEYNLPDRLNGWVIDCGAHIGSFSYACMLRGAVRVIGFEPNIENQKLACSNLAPYPVVEIRWGALNPGKPGLRTLYFKKSILPENTGGGTIHAENGIPVPAFSLDEVLAGLPGKGLLKLDCEGSEYGIIEHSKLLTQKIHSLVGECHFHEKGMNHFRGYALKNLLESKGYKAIFKPGGRQGFFLACQGALWPSWLERPLLPENLPPPAAMDPILRFFGLTAWPDEVTFGLFCPGLGDVLRSVQLACWVQTMHKVRVSLHTQWHGIPNVDYSDQPLADREALIREILAVLDTPAKIELVREAPKENYFSLCGVFPFYVPNVPTKLRWRGDPERPFKRIAYQVDGQSTANLKNPPTEDLPSLLSFAPGYEFVRLGKHLSVEACLETASTCDLFFGVDSGMLQLCYAAGIPSFLILYRQDYMVLDVWHGCRSGIHCKDTQDFLFKVRSYLALA